MFKRDKTLLGGGNVTIGWIAITFLLTDRQRSASAENGGQFQSKRHVRLFKNLLTLSTNF